MEQVNNVMDILTKLETIENGWMDVEKNVYKNVEKGFKKKYVLSNPEEVLKNKVGTCFDIVELERNYFKGLGIKFNTFFMIYYEGKKVYTHTFVVYEENEKFYWFEHAWTKDKGVHEFMSLFDLLTCVREKFTKYNNIKFMDADYLCVYKYKKPKFHIGLKDFYKHCENGENVII
ncbi:MAG: hypothetical protein HFI36_00285 [Bacilli bacterium]|jgi:hypothetical protein|nr:hypothetical protein [Bacilli bacterium]MCX4253768.1 hypothetical protein [Bacilli bacterium]